MDNDWLSGDAVKTVLLDADGQEVALHEVHRCVVCVNIESPRKVKKGWRLFSQ